MTCRADHSGRPPRNILIVDDDPDCRTLACEAIRSRYPDSRAFAVSGGLEAIDFLHRQGRHRQAPRPDLICTDLEMPEISGLELLGLIQADPALRDIPVMIFSGVDDEAQRRRALRAGARDYAVKPTDAGLFPGVLARTLGRCLAGRRLVQGRHA
jgi:two-component system response regulator